jgi:hypothetical protein
MCTGLAAEDLERQVLRVPSSTNSIPWRDSIRLRGGLRLPELVTIDITSAPPKDGRVGVYAGLMYKVHTYRRK